MAVDISCNDFELSTYQRRMRHLKCLALRNLCWPGHSGKDLMNLQSYFTLQIDRRSQAFYTSEKIQDSLNPTWQSFDISRYEDKVNTKSKLLVLKIWVGVKNKFDLLIDWDVNLMGLVFFADKLQQDILKYATNSVIFGMFDKYFIAPEESLPKESILEKSFMIVDQDTVRNSYRASSVSRIYTVLRATKQTKAIVNKYHRCIEDKLLSSQEKTCKLSRREALIMKRTQLRSELTWQSTRLQSTKDDLDKIKNENLHKENKIKEKYLKLTRSKEELLDNKKSYNQTRENFIKEEAQWKIRRKQLIGELATYVYPITENSKKECFVCHVMLPDSENFQGCDDVQVAVALGFTAHMVSMMSHILDYPLRYPIDHRGSRSQIKDHIHHKLTEKDNSFPLYAKGKEKFYFNYGVYLLNKNIGQLRYYCGMGTADLRTTLQNINSLLILRLGTKLETQTPLKNVCNIQVNSSNEIDTQSSLASDGRLKAPYSSDLAEAKLSRSCDDDLSNDSSANSITNRKNIEHADFDDFSFHPSPDDNFFKISNPVSDKCDILNDVDALESTVTVTELVDLSNYSSNQNNSLGKQSTDADSTRKSGCKSVDYFSKSDKTIQYVLNSVENTDTNGFESCEITQTCSSETEKQNVNFKTLRNNSSGQACVQSQPGIIEDVINKDVSENLNDCDGFEVQRTFKTVMQNISNSSESSNLSDVEDL